jgi:hypothetical protein
MMDLWMGVCLLCQKCTLICLVLKTCLKFSLYSMLNKNSNMMISKLWGVCHTKSCDHPCGIEITWGLKISKLLNLITYSLACLLTCTNWVLSCICEHLAKHASQIFVALFEMMPSKFIYACFGWDRSSYAYGGLA